jgi:hypothetical protein
MVAARVRRPAVTRVDFKVSGSGSAPDEVPVTPAR